MTKKAKTIFIVLFAAIAAAIAFCWSPWYPKWISGPQSSAPQTENKLK